MVFAYPLLLLIAAPWATVPSPEPAVQVRDATQFVVVRGFSYRFVELDYSVVDIDGFSDDAVGPSIAASFSVQENLFLFGSLGRTKVDDSAAGRLETDTFEFGFGLHTPLAENADFVARVSWLRADASGSVLDDQENGYALGAGVRAWVLDQVELDAALEYVDLDHSDTGFSVGGRYYVTDPLSLRVGLTHFDDTSSLTFGVRFSF